MDERRQHHFNTLRNGTQHRDWEASKTQGRQDFWMTGVEIMFSH
jgi:hypothetical protein